MRLSELNLEIHPDIDDAILLTEGILGDLFRAGTSRLYASMIRNKDLERMSPRIQKLIKTAKDAPYSLLDNDSEEWWQNVFSAFGVDDESISKPIFKRVTDKIESRIDRTEESAERRLEELEGKKGKRRQKLKRRTRLEDLYYLRSLDATIVEAGFGDIMAGAMDMMSPKTRAKLGAKLARSSNNLKIAALAVKFIESELDYVQREKRQRTKRLRDKKPVEAEIVDEPNNEDDEDNDSIIDLGEF